MKEEWELFVGRLFFDGPVRRRTWRKLSVQLRHGVGLEYSLTLMRDRYAARKSFLAKVFSRIIDGLRRGESLDVALFSLVPVEETMLIRGGYTGGNLAQSLELCAEQIASRQGIISAVIGAVAYPALLLLVFIVMLLTLALYVIPELSLLGNPEQWNGAAAVLFKVSTFVASPAGAMMFILFLLLMTGSLISLPYWTGKLRLYVENIAPWSIYRLLVGTTWLFSVATLQRSGVQLNFILDDMLQHDLRPWLRERITAIRAEYSLGKNLGNVLADTKLHFPDDEMIEDLIVYANLPDFHTQLHTLAGEWLRDGIRRVKEQAKILNTICIIGIFSMLAGVAVAVGSMQQQLTSTMGGM